MVIVILPIYPSLAVIGSDYEARAGDYDETTIITAYEGDAGMEGSYINKSGLVSTQFDVVTWVTKTSEKNDTSPSTWGERAKTYTVVTWDTLASIASKYGISQESILWANDYNDKDSIKAGTILRIPPVSGVVHRITRGDTISEIASHYSVTAAEILRVNDISGDTTLKIGMSLMIPWATQNIIHTQSKPALAKTDQKSPIAQALKPVPSPTPSTKPVVTDTKTWLKSRYLIKYTGLSRGFAWGNCTWYVAQNKTVTWRGNANAWIKNARAKGIATGQRPVPWAIIQFGGRGYNRYYGHVGIVADVTDDYVIVKDMNYRRINEVTIRKVPKNDPTIQWYIYVD
jgi:LysM repeat protein